MVTKILIGVLVGVLTNWVWHSVRTYGLAALNSFLAKAEKLSEQLLHIAFDFLRIGAGILKK